MLTVATYNLYLGADLSVVFGVSSPEELGAQAQTVLDQVTVTDFPARAAAIAGILARERVDLVGLQEVARWSRTVTAPDGTTRTEVWLGFLDELLAALAARGAAYDVHACAASFRGGAIVPGEGELSVQGHNAILARRGGAARVVEERTGDFSHSFDIPTGVPELLLTVNRSWGWVDVEVGAGPLRFVNTHLEAWDEQVRCVQRDQMLGLLGDSTGPVVVVGDFNAPPQSVRMPPEYVDAWAVAGVGDGPTCGQAADLRGDSALTSRIDYVWVRGPQVAACRRVGHRTEDRTASGLWPSDHAGVVADLVL